MWRKQRFSETLKVHHGNFSLFVFDSICFWLLFHASSKNVNSIVDDSLYRYIVLSSWDSYVHIMKNHWSHHEDGKCLMRRQLHVTEWDVPSCLQSKIFVRFLLISPHHPLGNCTASKSLAEFLLSHCQMFFFFPFCQRWILSKSRKTITNKFSWQLENRRLWDIFSDIFDAARLVGFLRDSSVEKSYSTTFQVYLVSCYFCLQNKFKFQCLFIAMLIVYWFTILSRGGCWYIDTRRSARETFSNL